MGFYAVRWDRWFVRNSKSCRSGLALKYDVGVEVLKTSSATGHHIFELKKYSTFRGSPVSENPVASAVGRRAESDFARCSVIVSVAIINPQVKEKDEVTDEKALSSRLSVSGR
jgi:hypothetical protein